MIHQNVVIRRHAVLPIQELRIFDRDHENLTERERDPLPQLILTIDHIFKPSRIAVIKSGAGAISASVCRNRYKFCDGVSTEIRNRLRFLFINPSADPDGFQSIHIRANRAKRGLSEETGRLGIIRYFV